MASQDFLLRARRPASLVAFNTALPNNFKLIHKPESTWLPLPGVHVDPIASLTLKSAILDSNGDVTTPAARVRGVDMHWDSSLSICRRKCSTRPGSCSESGRCYF